jgi:hypothetical protein
MNEIRAPLTRPERAQLRCRRIVELHGLINRLQLQLRIETTALVVEDTSPGDRRYVADELALELAESHRTCQRWVDEAQMLTSYPQVQALVADGTWSLRHADAVLDELVGTPAAARQQVLDLVLTDRSAVTPHQLRKATRAARLLHDLEGATDTQDRIHENRGVRLVDEYDGSATLQVGGTKTGAAAMLAAIDAHVTIPAPGEVRSLAQRRYDFVMDLLCGRTQVTAPWQALIVVSLETLEGGDQPAEIPGLGLVTADEARQVLAQAELRRAVIDPQGQLVALDDTVLTGDQSPLGPAPPDQVAWDTEPEEITDPEPVATVSDREWLASQETPDTAEGEYLAARAARREEQLLTLCATGIRQLEHHLHAHRHTPAHAGPCRHQPPPEPEPPGPPEGPPEGPPSGGSGPPRPGPSRPGGDGKGHPHDPPPHEEPPSWADRDWLHIQEDVSGSHDQLDQQAHLAHQACRTVLRPTLPATVWAPSLRAQQRAQDRLHRQARASRWTSPALRAAVSTLRTAPPAPVPAASRSYPFRGRLARWIRARDITCTFPGCHLLAQRCELDHVLAYPQGTTEACNGACECTHHHQAKHAVMTVTRLPDGTMRWTTRFGTTRDRPPRPLLRGW